MGRSAVTSHISARRTRRASYSRLSIAIRILLYVSSNPSGKLLSTFRIPDTEEQFSSVSIWHCTQRNLERKTVGQIIDYERY